MKLAEQIGKIVIILIIGGLGFIINSAILVFYIRLWRKVTSAGVTDTILLSTGVTGLLLQCSLINNGFMAFLYSQGEINPNYCLGVLYVLFVIYNTSFWNTAWLSVSYCLKLLNTSHRFIYLFKQFFSSNIRKFLTGSAICSVGVNLPLFWTANLSFLNNKNISYEMTGFKMEVNVYYCVYKIFGYVVPFTMTLLCIGLSVASLLHHVWRMRQNLSQSSSSPQFQALLQAVVTMTVRVMLDLTFLVIVIYTTVVSFSVNLAVLVVVIGFLLSYPSIQSLALIFGNPKLKRCLFCQKVRKSFKG